jgi:flagellar basal-body rod modification protein FlgD
METQPISNLFNLPTPAGSESAGDALGRDEFLELLTVQLRYQDPLNPMSNQEFASQLAEFAALEQMQQVNEAMQSDLLIGQSLNNAMATSMIGRSVQVVGGEFSMPAEESEMPDLFIYGAGDDVTVTIRDSAGEVVRTLELTAGESGPTEIVWDGRDDDGDRLEPGDYQFTAEAGNGDPLPTLVEGRIDRIRFENGTTQLIIGNVAYTLADVIEIRA